MSVLLSKARGTFDQCRWVVCEAAEPARRAPSDIFNGSRVCGAPVSWPTSYCPVHRLVVYERTVREPGAPRDLSLLHRPPEPEARPELTEIFG